MASSLSGSSAFTCKIASASVFSSTHKVSVKMPLKSISASSPSLTSVNSCKRKLPILLFDVMDTLVRDPFYDDIPSFFRENVCNLRANSFFSTANRDFLFRMSMAELLECKHPTTWIEFEKGLIDELELARAFFKDGRSFDLEGLKKCMRNGYSYLEGVEELLHALKENGYEIHAFTNYPIWYQIIEEKLKLSTYLSWTFCSCIFGKRKPEADFYEEVLKHLNVEPGNCIFIDDRMKNIEAAIEAGFKGLRFKGVDLLREDLSGLGVDLSGKDHGASVNQAECS